MGQRINCRMMKSEDSMSSSSPLIESSSITTISNLTNCLSNVSILSSMNQTSLSSLLSTNLTEANDVASSVVTTCHSNEESKDDNDYMDLSTADSCSLTTSSCSESPCQSSSSSIATHTETSLCTNYRQQLDLLLQLESLKYYNYQQWYWIPSSHSTNNSAGRVEASASSPSATASNVSISPTTTLVDVECRTTMIRWFYQFVRHVQSNRITVEYAIWYMDRYMYIHYNERKDGTHRPKALTKSKGDQYSSDRLFYQLVCLTCIYMAVKIQETSVGIDLQLISNISRSAHSPNEIQQMECTILQSLQWYMHPPVLSNFVDLYYLNYAVCSSSFENSNTTCKQLLSAPMEAPELISVVLQERIEETMCYLTTLTSKSTSQIAYELVQEYILQENCKKDCCTLQSNGKEHLRKISTSAANSSFEKSTTSNNMETEHHVMVTAASSTSIACEVEDIEQQQQHRTAEEIQLDWKRTKSPCTTVS